MFSFDMDLNHAYLSVNQMYFNSYTLFFRVVNQLISTSKLKNVCYELYWYVYECLDYVI